MSGHSFHESFTRDHRVATSSDRTFGIVSAVLFALIAAWPLWNGRDVRWWAAAISAVVLVVAWLRPTALGLLNRLWLRFGLLLNRIVTPVVMAVIFFVTVTPTALIMRVFGRDPLRRRFDPVATSYWIERQPPGPAPETMINQF